MLASRFSQRADQHLPTHADVAAALSAEIDGSLSQCRFKAFLPRLGPARATTFERSQISVHAQANNFRRALAEP